MEVTKMMCLGTLAAAIAYLPPDTHVEASIYPVIKRSVNSFVFELDSNPAIFVHIDPERSAEELENVLAHELHHVGSATCPPVPGIDTLPAATKRAVEWLSGFGEGLAVLAAAGGPEVHPHASSDARAWVAWERDVANFNRDLRRMESFFLELIDGALADSEEGKALFALINTEEVPQGRTDHPVAPVRRALSSHRSVASRGSEASSEGDCAVIRL